MRSFWTVKRKIFLGLIAVSSFATVFAWQQVFALVDSPQLKVDVLDIGQGDAIFIQTPLGHQVLIDGGPTSAVLGKLQQRLPFLDRSLDMVILTHPDADHMQGLLDVLQSYQADYIIWSGIVRDGQGYQRWLDLLVEQQKKGARVITASAGLSLRSGDAELLIIHPFENLAGQVYKKSGNETGVVSRLSYGENSFLFTADISSIQEKALVGSKTVLTSDVLKVAHHGSKFSSSEEFLQAVGASLAVISAGKKNPYGHPTAETLQRLLKFDIKVLRTDQDGDIMMVSDGKNINVK